MEVLVGTPYSMDVSPSCVRDRTTAVPAQDKLVSSSFLFDAAGGDRQPQHQPSAYGSDDDSSDSSSSIGDPGDTDEEQEDENDDVSSSKGEEEQRREFCLDSLEDSLPVKRGLSNHFTGKSKSFGNLLDVSTCSLKDVEKPENPFNKRRRLLMANKWSRKAFYSWQNPKSMPLLPALNEDDDDDDHHNQQLQPRKQEEEEEDDDVEEEVKTKTSARPKIGFKSQSCFSLADLQEEDDDE